MYATWLPKHIRMKEAYLPGGEDSFSKALTLDPDVLFSPKSARSMSSIFELQKKR